MYWRKGKRWQAGIALAGLLVLLALTAWFPVSVVSAQESVLGFALAGPVTVQATPTVDVTATVTALNEEKLQHENDWWWNYGSTILSSLLSTLVLVSGALVGFAQWRGGRRDAVNKESQDRQAERERRDQEQQRWLEDRQAEREKREEDQTRWLTQQQDQLFQNTIEGLGTDKPEAKAIAASMLLTFLQQRGYERFHQQVFNLAVTNLRLQYVDPSAPEPPDTLRQALSIVFKEAFHRVRDSSGDSFEPQSLDAGRIHLERTFLWKADLKQIWMPWAFLRDADLSEADLSEARLWGGGDAYEREGGDFRRVKLWGADLSKADLGATNLFRADLSLADLSEAKLWANLSEAWLLGAKLVKAKLRRGNYSADLSGARLNGADLSGADLSYTKLIKARLGLALLIQPGSQVRSVETNLSSANSSGAELQESTFIPQRHADYRAWLRFREAELQESTFIRTNLSGADLSGADLTAANLTRTNLEDAECLKGAILYRATGLTAEQLAACQAKGAIIDENTTISSSLSSVDSSLLVQSNTIPALLAQHAQVTPPISDIDGSNALSSKLSPEL